MNFEDTAINSYGRTAGQNVEMIKRCIPMIYFDIPAIDDLTNDNLLNFNHVHFLHFDVLTKFEKIKSVVLRQIDILELAKSLQ